MNTMDVVKEFLDIEELREEIAHLATQLVHKRKDDILGALSISQIKDREKVDHGIRKALQKSFEEDHARMRRGLGLLSESGLLHIDFKNVAVLSSMVRKRHEPQNEIQEKLDITDEALVGMYECGAKFFSLQDYTSAADVFMVLVFFNAGIPSFWIGLGMAEEMRRDFQSAAFAFLMAAEVCTDGLLWAIKSAECFAAISQKEAADCILDKIIEKVGNDPRQAPIRDRALAMKAACL